jgi:hypothetical protein
MILGMFAQQAKLVPPAVDGIQFVGSSIQSGANSVAFDFSGLTGGIDTAAADGDYLMIISATARSGAAGASLTVVPTGVSATSIANAQGSDSVDGNCRCYAGFHEAGSETGGTVGITGSSMSIVTAIFVFRGVDPVTPLDVAPTEVSRTNGCDITLVSITPVTAGAVIVCAAASGSQSNANTYFDPSTIDNIIKLGRGSTYDASLIVGTGTPAWTSGAFSPGLFDFNGGDSLSSAGAFSIALRPA